MDVIPSCLNNQQINNQINFFFNVLLNVHLSIFILVINQLYAQNCFTVSLFHASTCFEHHVPIARRSKLYYTASGIITLIGGRPVHGTHCKTILCIKLVNY